MELICSCDFFEHTGNLLARIIVESGCRYHELRALCVVKFDLSGMGRYDGSGTVEELIHLLTDIDKCASPPFYHPHDQRAWMQHCGTEMDVRSEPPLFQKILRT